MQDTIVILEEVNHPYPRCPQCNMFLPQKDLNVRHLAAAFCRGRMERKWNRLAEEEAQEGTDRAITDYGYPLSQVTSFNYLGQVLSAEDNDWTEVVHKLR